MSYKAIIYSSNTGFTKKYAYMLGKKLDLDVYSIDDNINLTKEEKIIYLGWLFANNIKDYKKINIKYNIGIICAVGLCETGCLLDEVRKTNKIPNNIPLFTLQGGMDHTKLKGINKFMINSLIKVLDKQKEKSEDDIKKLNLIKNGGDYVSENNLKEVIKYYNENN